MILFYETLFIYVLFTVSYFVLEFYNIIVPLYIYIFVMITVIFHSFVGNLLNLYNTSRHFDRYLHAFGTFSFTLFTYSILDSIIKPTVTPSLYSVLFVVFLGISIGSIFEIIEFSMDLIYKTDNQKGLKDTDFDLIFDCFGAIAAGVFVYFTMI